MNFGPDQHNISNLPPEVIMKIQSYLSLTEIQTSRSISKSFNDAGRYLLCMELRKMRAKLDKVIERNGLFLISPVKRRNTSLNARRLMLGISSVLKLSGVLRIYDAFLFPLMVAGALPPLPVDLLDHVAKAVTIGTRRNPIIARSRIHRVLCEFERFSINNIFPCYDGKPLEIDSCTALKIIVDLLDLLPFSVKEEQKTTMGLQIWWKSPICYLFKEDVEQIHLGNMLLTTTSKVSLEALHQLALYVIRTLYKYSSDPHDSLIVREMEKEKMEEKAQERFLNIDEMWKDREVFLDIASVPPMDSLDQLNDSNIMDLFANLSLELKPFFL